MTRKLSSIIDENIKPEEFIVLRSKYISSIKNNIMDEKQAETMLFFYRSTVRPIIA